LKPVKNETRTNCGVNDKELGLTYVEFWWGTFTKGILEIVLDNARFVPMITNNYLIRDLGVGSVIAFIKKVLVPCGLGRNRYQKVKQ
jgi:hypothetical protein